MFALLAELSLAQSQSPVALDTNETLFTVLTAINTCGYDQDLRVSDPLRSRVRDEVARARQGSQAAEDATQAMCQYYEEHQQPDASKALAQYVSLALYLNPPPRSDGQGEGCGHASRCRAGVGNPSADAEFLRDGGFACHLGGQPAKPTPR